MEVDFNTDADHIDIPFSKYKLTGLLCIALAFAAVGIWFVIDPGTFVSIGYHHRFKQEIFLIGFICVIFCAPAAAFIAYKIFSSKPGLIIDEEGITNNSTFASGFIKWADITDITMERISSSVYIMIHINNAEEYIEGQQNFLKRKSALANYKKYNAPIAIITDSLKCDYNELYTFLTDTLNIYKNASKV